MRDFLIKRFKSIFKALFNLYEYCFNPPKNPLTIPQIP
ncbi:hypothetical protein HPHPP25_1694 [Helicobacter pylori Hp P-25]|nr:hypothetical protein HPHPP25_1694 [Helicobacter pylori Hp P-25]EJC33303.1 hypothetical protein HPHPP25C_1424 [Helicobacter pylori Hp P-25c]EJC38929.1 hypothetical protein HPHPP25D_0609 [Helicobacter pylori Hp P-25d]